MTLQLNPNDPNGVMLERVASRLGGGLCDRSAFVGGAISQHRLPDLQAKIFQMAGLAG